MLRRDAMLALAGAAVPLALAARPSGAQAQTASASTPYAYPYYLVLQLGTVSLQTCQVLLARSINPLTRTFAQIESIEQVAVAQALTNNFNPPPALLTPAQQAVITTLENVPVTEVDATFVTSQITAHETLLGIQQTALSVYAAFPSYDIVHQTLLIRSNLQQHLILLNDIKQALQLI